MSSKNTNAFKLTNGMLIPSDIMSLRNLGATPLVRSYLTKIQGTIVISIGPAGTTAVVQNKKGEDVSTLEDLQKISGINAVLSKEGRLSSKREKSESVFETFYRLVKTYGVPSTELVPLDNASLAAMSIEVAKLETLGKFRKKLLIAKMSEAENQFLQYCCGQLEYCLHLLILSLGKGKRENFKELLLKNEVPRWICNKILNQTSSLVGFEEFLYPSNYAQGFSLSIDEIKSERICSILAALGLLDSFPRNTILKLIKDYVDPENKEPELGTFFVWVPPYRISDRIFDSFEKKKLKPPSLYDDLSIKNRVGCLNSALFRNFFGFFISSFKILEWVKAATGKPATRELLKEKAVSGLLKENRENWAKFVGTEIDEHYLLFLNEFLNVPNIKDYLLDDEFFDVKKATSVKPLEAVDSEGIKTFRKEHFEESGDSKAKRKPLMVTAIPKSVQRTLNADDTFSESARKEIENFLRGFSSRGALEAAFELLASSKDLLLEENEPSDQNSEDE